MDAITTTPEQSGSTALDRPMSMREGMAAVRAEMLDSGDAAEVNDFVKFAKGEWLFGDDKRGEKPLNGRRALFDSNRIQHGWICWGREKGKPKKLADFMRPVNIPVPDDASGFEDLRAQGGTWMKQKVLSARFLDGDMEQFRWGVTSKGGFSAVAGLMDAIMAQWDFGGNSFPIIELSSGSYIHREFGTVYTPGLRIIGWSGPEGPNNTPAPATLPVDTIGRLDDEIPFEDSAPAPVKGRAGK